MPTINQNISEDELLHLLATNGKEGMSILYDKYADVLYGIALKIVHSETLAEDVLQDSFVKIWQNFGSYDKSKGRLFTWMLNITRNKAIDYTRSKNFKNSAYKDELKASHAPGKLTTKIEHIGIAELINQLPLETKTVIEVVYMKGYTHAEAAEFLNLPLGTVKTRVRNGLKKLRQLV